MADQAIVHIGENSVEGVAFKLLERIIFNSKQAWDQEDTLNLYAVCLKTVRGNRAPAELL